MVRVRAPEKTNQRHLLLFLFLLFRCSWHGSMQGLPLNCHPLLPWPGKTVTHPQNDTPPKMQTLLNGSMQGLPLKCHPLLPWLGKTDTPPKMQTLLNGSMQGSPFRSLAMVGENVPLLLRSKCKPWSSTKAYGRCKKHPSRASHPHGGNTLKVTLLPEMQALVIHKLPAEL